VGTLLWVPESYPCEVSSKLKRCHQARFRTQQRTPIELAAL
jgi:hypothetical protein